MVQKDPFRNDTMPALLWGLDSNWFISLLCFFRTCRLHGSMIVWTNSCPTDCRSFKFWYSARFIPFACENIQTMFTAGMCDRCFEWNLLVIWPWLLMCLRLWYYFMQHPESNLYSKYTVPMTITKWGLFSNHFLPICFSLRCLKIPENISPLRMSSAPYPSCNLLFLFFHPQFCSSLWSVAPRGEVTGRLMAF